MRPGKPPSDSRALLPTFFNNYLFAFTGDNEMIQNFTDYHPVDKYMRQPRLMKLNITNIDENYLSYDVVSIALVYFLNLLHLSLNYAIQFFLIDIPQNLLQGLKNQSSSTT
jgi:mannose/fructose/N-acetylgalactosamine-specific phosphotransferase system component IIC